MFVVAFFVVDRGLFAATRAIGVVGVDFKERGFMTFILAIGICGIL